MGHSSLRVFSLASILLLALVSAAAGQSEFFLYQSPCQVTVTGNLDVTASITGAASASSTDNHDFTTTHAIPSTTALSFSDSGDADANVTISYVDGCTTRGTSSISGETGYDFVGDLDDMIFTAGSNRSHADSITRGLFGGPGTAANADSEYTVPQLDAIEVFVPFQVAGGDNGKITVTDFELKRTDTGSTTGNMVTAWQVFEDVNGNCKLDFPADQAVGGDAGIVFPNDSYVGPSPTFATPRGSYILWLTYFNNSDENASSASCLQNASASSDVRDSVKVRLELN